MNRRAALLILQSVRRRIRQGDCPTEPPFERETLEEALDELGPSPQAVKIMLDPDDEPSAGPSGRAERRADRPSGREEGVVSRCAYCAPLHEPCCGARLDEPGQDFFCTRRRNHGGKHVACGTFEHDVKRWHQRVASSPPPGDSK